MVVTKAVRQALLRWARELECEQHEGVPLAACSPPPAADSAAAAAIYADAALDCHMAGFGAWAVRGDELLYVHGEWTREERQLLICDLELAASTLGLVALQPLLRRSFIYSFTDNTVAMAAMRQMSPSTDAMQRLSAARATWMLAQGVGEAAERVTSAANLWADMLSRGDAAGVLQQAATLGLRTRRVDVPAEWRELVAHAAWARVHEHEGHAGGDEGAHAPLTSGASCARRRDQGGSASGGGPRAGAAREPAAAHA